MPTAKKATTRKKKTQPKAEVSTALNVAFLLDMSGSMGIIRDEAVEGTQAYLRDLKADLESETTRFSLAIFDDQYEVWIEDKPVNEASFPSQMYQPRGWTALYDAIAKTIAVLDASEHKDEKHLVVILTDGMENSSVEYRGEAGRQALAKLIDAYEKRGNWTFVYLGANDYNVKTTAANIGIAHGNSAYYSASSTSTPVAMASIGHVTRSVKGMSAGSSSSVFDDAGISDDFRDEDDKEKP